MSKTIRRRIVTLALALLLGPALAEHARAQDYPTPEAYTRYLTNDPWNEQPAWAERAQGLAHDESHWYISQKQRLWAIHRSVDLGSVSGHGAGVYSTRASEFPELADYEHYSDLDFVDIGSLEGHEPVGAGRYVVMAVDDPDKEECGLVALFSAYDPARPEQSLKLVATACLPYLDRAPWLAIDAKGRVYASLFDDVGRLNRYAVDWSADFASSRVVPIACEREPADPVTAAGCGSGIDLHDANGAPMRVDGVQGVAFSESGEVVYVSTRYDGLYVFRARDGRLLERSCNGDCRFEFRFDDSSPVGLEQEPEGLTVWDLEEATDLGGETRGSLHVLLLDKTWIGGDHVYIKHYSGRVYAEGGGMGGDGRLASPFGGLDEALSAAWNGARLVFLGETAHPGVPTIGTPLRLESRGGPSLLGP